MIRSQLETLAKTLLSFSIPLEPPATQVMLVHRNILCKAVVYSYNKDRVEDDTWRLFLPHTGMACHMLGPVYEGGTKVIMARLTPNCSNNIDMYK